MPRLRLTGEEVLVIDETEERPARAALARLCFDYGDRKFVPHRPDELDPAADPTFDRCFSEEARAERILESLGASELSQIDGLVPEYDSAANYFITFASESHLGASFSAYAVPELVRLGFEVEFAPSYPFVTAPADCQFYASVDTDEKLDWFNIEIGIEIEGKSYSLVPALLELLESCGQPISFEHLARSPGKLRAVALGDGRFSVMPWERLERILLVLSDLCPDRSHRGEEFRLPIARLADLCELDETFETSGCELSWRSETDWLSRAKSLRAGPSFSPQPTSLRATLRPYQHEGLMWLEHKRDAGVGAVLADDMGLGKTLQTIALLCREKEARRMDIPSLIVAPTSLVDNWHRELRRFAPHIRVVIYAGPRRHRLIGEFHKAEVIVTSYPVLIRDLTPLTDREFHYVILDEAQTIKNARSLANTSVRALSARHRLALSGTPVENNLGELWALFEFTHPGLLGRLREFNRQFRDPIEKFGDEAQLTALKKRVTPFILRRLKESVARDLPSKTELVRAVELTGPQRDLYESIRLAGDRQVRQVIAQKGLAASTVTILDALMKLRQVCCDPRLLPVEQARRVQESAKYELFFELLEGQLEKGRRVLVFSQFAQMLGLLGRGLTQRKLPYLMLTGASPHRQALVDQFEQGRADVFLISLKAGGTGLNLVSADTVIHYDPWWNAAAQMQATDRAYRIGQKNPVFVYNLIAASSVEQSMLRLQERKRNLADHLLDGSQGTPLLSAADIDDLFAPLSDEAPFEDGSTRESKSTRPAVSPCSKVARDDDDDNALAPR